MVTSNLFFFAETHGFLDDFKKQKEIIDRILPEFVLLEQLQNFEIINETDFQKIKKLSKFSNIINLLEYCITKNIKLIGIDLLDFGFSGELKRKIDNQLGLTQDEEKILSKILEKRNQTHLKKIKEYSKITDTNLFVSMGAWHFSSQSTFLKNFENYTLIFPSNENGDLIFEPTDESLKFKEIKK